MISKTFDVGDHPEIDVRIHAGRVEVIEGEPGRVEVVVETNDKEFQVGQRGDIIEAHADREARWLFSSPAEVSITMPPGGRALIRTASGDVVAKTNFEKAEIDSASGDVRLHSAARAIVKTASGNIRIQKVDESLKAKSASGDVNVEVANGTVEITTASGDVHIGSSDAFVEVNTASGRVRVDRYTGSDIALKSMSGNFEVGLETGTKVALDASSLSGKVTWPPKRDVPPELKREMRMKAKSVSGDLTITRVE